MATPPLFLDGEILYASSLNKVGLWLVKTQTVTAGVTNVLITNAFSSDYDNYRIVIENFETSAPVGLSMQMGTTAGASYYWSGLQVSYATGVTASEFGNAGASWSTGLVGTGAKAGGTIEVQSPNLARATSFQTASTDARTAGSGARQYTGFLNNTTQYTSFTLLLGAFTMSSMKVSVYGYRY
jgi:hypothetical protein